MTSLADRLTRSQEAAQEGHRYRAAYLTPIREWERDALDQALGPDYEPRHEMTFDTGVRFVELPGGDVRKIRVFA